MSCWWATALAMLIVLAPCLASAQIITGRVVRVVDGDTLYVLDAANTQHKIRLGAIDAPERKQAFGTKSKEHLSDLVATREVTVEYQKRDRYQRIVGRILAEGRDINLEMVRAGMAWWYVKFASEQSSQDRQRYAQAEEAARASRRGLWRDPEPIPPWDWRQQKR